MAKRLTAQQKAARFEGWYEGYNEGLRDGGSMALESVKEARLISYAITLILGVVVGGVSVGVALA